MAGSYSDFLELALLDNWLGNDPYSVPATIHVALYTAAPSDPGGGTEVGVGTWTNYARAAVTNNLTNWPSGNPKSNGTVVSFGTVTASGPVTVVAFGLFDAASGGNLLGWATLTTNKTVNNGDQPSFAVGALVVTSD